MRLQIKQRITNAWKGLAMEPIGKAGIAEMLAKNPGSEVTTEQLSKIDMSRKGSSDLSAKKPTLDEMVRQLVDMPDDEFEGVYKAAIFAKKQRNEILGVTQTDEEIADSGDHKHNWRRGILPGSKYIKTCNSCWETENVSFDEWQTLG